MIRHLLRINSNYQILHSKDSSNYWIIIKSTILAKIVLLALLIPMLIKLDPIFYNFFIFNNLFALLGNYSLYSTNCNPFEHLSWSLGCILSIRFKFFRFLNLLYLFLIICSLIRALYGRYVIMLCLLWIHILIGFFNINN